MKFIRCRWTRDNWGIYVTPLFGFSWRHGKKAVWVGWLYWLFEVEF